MIFLKFAKRFLKDLLSSNKLYHYLTRIILSKILLAVSLLLSRTNSNMSKFLFIYGCVFDFNPDRLAKEINSDFVALHKHLEIASRAFFEIAYAKGDLLRICHFLSVTTKFCPNLFHSWRLLLWCYYYTKKWRELDLVACDYEKVRNTKLKAVGIKNCEIVIGDHITSSIGHSEIFFELEILRRNLKDKSPDIAILISEHDRMSGFYSELVPNLIAKRISLDLIVEKQPNLKNFIQDSFSFLISRKYLNYSDDRNRAKSLVKWVSGGATPFFLVTSQKKILASYLEKLGINNEDWYVILHIRDSTDNSIRNNNLETYYDAIDEVVANGGWVLRIGDRNMPPLSKGGHKILDLTREEVPKPNYADMYLLATARFVICTPSGPGEFPFFFNVPRVMTNWTNMPGLFGTYEDICLPVAYYFKDKIVPLREQIFSASYDYEPSIKALVGLRWEKNTAKQIRDSTLDMIKKTDFKNKKNNFSVPDADSLGHRFQGELSFLGEISKSFLEDNLGYLD